MDTEKLDRKEKSRNQTNTVKIIMDISSLCLKDCPSSTEALVKVFITNTEKDAQVPRGIKMLISRTIK